MKTLVARLGLSGLLVACLAGCSAPSIVSMDEYSRVAAGMSYSQVATVVGDAGQESSSASTAGVIGPKDAVVIKVYTWENPDGSSMLCTFQSDKLVSKVQMGL